MSVSFHSLGLKHTRLPSPSLCPRVCSNARPLRCWCHLTIPSSAALFSFSPFLIWQSTAQHVKECRVQCFSNFFSAERNCVSHRKLSRSSVSRNRSTGTACAEAGPRAPSAWSPTHPKSLGTPCEPPGPSVMFGSLLSGLPTQRVSLDPWWHRIRKLRIRAQRVAWASAVGGCFFFLVGRVYILFTEFEKNKWRSCRVVFFFPSPKSGLMRYILYIE